MPSQLGTAVNFAFGSAAGITVNTPTLTGHLLQSANNGLESDLATVRNGDGDVTTEIYHDQRGSAELRFVFSGANIAAARALYTTDNFPPGTVVNISACAARPDLVETNWIVTEAGPKIEGENNGVAMFMVPLRRRSGITAAAS